MYTYTLPPGSAFPCEAFGTIDVSGQQFSFRYRGGRASITIDADELMSSRKYEMRVSSPDAMPASVADALVFQWVKQYLRERDIARLIAELWKSCAIVESSIAPEDFSLHSVTITEMEQVFTAAFTTATGSAVCHTSIASLDRMLRATNFVISRENITTDDRGVAAFFTLKSPEWNLTFVHMH